MYKNLNDNPNGITNKNKKINYFEDINDDNKDINERIYSWKTVIQGFKEPAKGNNTQFENNNKNNRTNSLDITTIELIPCHDAIEISKTGNSKTNKKESKLERLLLPDMEEFFTEAIYTPIFFEPHYIEEN